MSSLAVQIAQLESDIFTLMDDLDFYQCTGWAVAYELKDELNRKRQELRSLTVQFDLESIDERHQDMVWQHLA